jgi:hypothetical protein
MMEELVRNFLGIFLYVEMPITEGELCSVDAQGFVKKVGKRSCDVKDSVGGKYLFYIILRIFSEFIGLAKVSKKAAQTMIDTYRELEKEYANNDQKPFVRAPR